MSRLLRAHTEEMATAIQDAIYEWLVSVNEKRAAKWFRKTWTGERGNYTNAAAGYVGNKVANSLESKWKYYRRDTTGTTGTNLRMPLDIFIPSHIKYVRDLSKKHFSDMVGLDGMVRFPIYPTITTEIWKEVQSLDARIIQLCYIEGTSRFNTEFSQAVSDIVTIGTTDMSFTAKLKIWHSDGNRLSFPRSVCGGIIMPSTHAISMFEKKGFTSLEQLREVVPPLMEQYQSMMIDMDAFMRENPQFVQDPEAIMDIMDCLYRVLPLTVRVGPATFKCVCTEGFVSYACVHSTLAAMFFDPDMEVPGIADITRLKDRPAKVRLTPFSHKRQWQEDPHHVSRVKKQARRLPQSPDTVTRSTSVGLRRLGRPPQGRGRGRGRGRGSGKTKVNTIAQPKSADSDSSAAAGISSS